MVAFKNAEPQTLQQALLDQASSDDTKVGVGCRLSPGFLLESLHTITIIGGACCLPHIPSAVSHVESLNKSPAKPGKGASCACA